MHRRDSLEATLTHEEMMIAGYVGCLRNVEATLRGWEASGDERETFNHHIEGAGGEMASGKCLNIYWEPIVNDTRANDLGPYQVRANCSRKHTHLCIRPKDVEKFPDKVFISTLSFWPRYEICGWYRISEGLKDEWYRYGLPNLPKCWYVPIGNLHSLKELPPE